MLIVPVQTEVVFLRYPWVNFVWIALCVLGFVCFNLLDMGWRMSSAMVLDGWDPVGVLGHVFLHANLSHLLGNLFFLWVFGNAVNERFGQLRYLLLAVAGTVVAAAAHNLFEGGAAVGASGAVNAVVGAYLVLYPVNRVSMFWWFLVRVGTFQVPGYVLIGFWFLTDLWGALGPGGLPIAYWAHVGGFLAGLALCAAWVGAGRVRLESYDNPDLLQALGFRRRSAPKPAASAGAPPDGRLDFQCPECGYAMSVAESALGGRVWCDRCRVPIQLEEAE